MELEQIKQILKENKKVVFAPPGLFHITVDTESKTITFTTDTPDCLIESGKLEEALEKLFAEFGIKDYKIEFHNHKGKWHDKDIIFKLENIKKMPRIVKFIQDNFYKTENWVYEVR